MAVDARIAISRISSFSSHAELVCAGPKIVLESRVVHDAVRVVLMERNGVLHGDGIEAFVRFFFERA